MMIGTGLICGIGVLIHIRKEKKKEADLMDSAIDAFFESVKIGKTTFCGLSATAMAFRDNGFDELSATARAFKDNGMTFACGSSGWVKDNVFNSKIEDDKIEIVWTNDVKKTYEKIQENKEKEFNAIYDRIIEKQNKEAEKEKQF